MIKLMTFIENNWIAFTLLTISAITILSLWPVDKLPSVPGDDKAHHVIAYTVLMFPTALRKPKYWKLLGLFFIAYSGAIELVQPMVNRYSEWLDMAANTTGLLCGLLLATLIIRFYSVISDRPG